MRSWMLCGFMLLLTGCYGGEIKELQETVVASNDNVVTMNDNLTTMRNSLQRVADEQKTRFDGIDDKVGKVSTAIDGVKTSVDTGNSTLAELKREQAAYLERVGDTIAKSVKDVVPSDEKLVEKAKEGFRAAKREVEEEAAARAKAAAEAEAAEEAAAEKEAARIRRILGVSPSNDSQFQGLQRGLDKIDKKVDGVSAEVRKANEWREKAEKEFQTFKTEVNARSREKNYRARFFEDDDALQKAVTPAAWSRIVTEPDYHQECNKYMIHTDHYHKCKYIRRWVIPCR